MLSLQHQAGNRALASVLASRPPLPVQRRSPTGQGAHGGAQAKGGAEDYTDLLEGFENLAVAAIDEQGRRLDSLPLGHHLTARHRALLEDVRKVLILAQDAKPAARSAAAATWPGLASKLETAVEEARQLGFADKSLAAVTAIIAKVGQEYVHARKTDASEGWTQAAYDDAVKAIGQLVGIFVYGPDPSPGILVEEVAGRPDMEVPMSMTGANRQQRIQLAAVTFGEHLGKRQRALLETAREALVLVRTEAPGSAYKALGTWRSVQPKLNRVLDLALNYVIADYDTIKKDLRSADREVAKHYAAVHRGTVGVALTPARSKAEKAADKALAAASPAAAAKLAAEREEREFREVLQTIDGIRPDPSRPGVWLLQSGPVLVAIGQADVVALRAKAVEQVNALGQAFVSVMVETKQEYEGRKEKAAEHRIVHALASFSSGAEDPGSMDPRLRTAIGLRDQVGQLAKAGNLVAAFDKLGTLEGFVQYEASSVDKWESDLQRGAGRWVTALTVLKDSLQILATAGAGAIVGEMVTAGTGAVSATATVAGATTVAGGGGALVGAVATGGDAKQAVRTGAATGLSIGASGGAAMIAGEAFGVAKATGALSKGVRTFAAGSSSGTVVGGLSAGVAGTSIKEGALGGAAGGGVGALGGAAVSAGAGGNTVLNTAGQTVVGTAAGGLGAAITHGDIEEGMIAGGAGGLYGSGGGGGGASGGGRASGGGGASSDGVPEPVVPGTDSGGFHVVPSSGVPEPVVPGTDTAGFHVVPSNGVPEPIGASPPASPYERTAPVGGQPVARPGNAPIGNARTLVPGEAAAVQEPTAPAAAPASPYERTAPVGGQPVARPGNAPIGSARTLAPGEAQAVSEPTAPVATPGTPGTTGTPGTPGTPGTTAAEQTPAGTTAAPANATQVTGVGTAPRGGGTQSTGASGQAAPAGRAPGRGGAWALEPLEVTYQTADAVEASQMLYRAVATGQHARVLGDPVQVQEAWQVVSGQPGGAPVAWTDTFGNVYVDGTRAPGLESIQPLSGPVQPGYDPRPPAADEPEAPPRQVDPYPGVRAGEDRGVSRAIQDPVEAARLVYGEGVAGRGIRHLSGRAYVEYVWGAEYGGQGRPPPAWLDGTGRLVVDADRVVLPFGEEQIPQGPVRD